MALNLHSFPDEYWNLQQCEAHLGSDVHRNQNMMSNIRHLTAWPPISCGRLTAIRFAFIESVRWKSITSEDCRGVILCFSPLFCTHYFVGLCDGAFGGTEVETSWCGACGWGWGWGRRWKRVGLQLPVTQQFQSRDFVNNPHLSSLLSLSLIPFALSELHHCLFLPCSQ